jgi:hypothetical protein
MHSAFEQLWPDVLEKLGAGTSVQIKRSGDDTSLSSIAQQRAQQLLPSQSYGPEETTIADEQNTENSDETTIAASTPRANSLSQQHGPAKPRGASGYYGVSASGERWMAQISYGGKKHHISTHDTKQEAALAYDREARRCGEEKALNFDSIEGAEEAAARARFEEEERVKEEGSAARARFEDGQYAQHSFFALSRTRVGSETAADAYCRGRGAGMNGVQPLFLSPTKQFVAYHSGVETPNVRFVSTEAIQCNWVDEVAPTTSRYLDRDSATMHSEHNRLQRTSAITHARRELAGCSMLRRLRLCVPEGHQANFDEAVRVMRDTWCSKDVLIEKAGFNCPKHPKTTIANDRVGGCCPLLACIFAYSFFFASRSIPCKRSIC